MNWRFWNLLSRNKQTVRQRMIDHIGRWFAYTGKSVSSTDAVSYSAVNNAIRILAETIASLPLHVYQRQGEDGKRKAREHPLYHLLHNQPNSEMTAFSFWELALHNVLLYGTFYAEIEKNRKDDVIGIWPLLSQNMQVFRDEGEIIYCYTLPDGQQVKIPKDNVFTFHGLSSNGVTGYGILSLAKESIALGLATEEFGARFFGNGATLGGVLEHPGELGETGRSNLRESFEETYTGLSRAHRLLILEEGTQYKPIGVDPDKAQFLETRKFQISEIARFFRVPPHMLADLERSTNNNIEHQSLEFVKYSIQPWVVRIEQAILWKLVSINEKQKVFAEFDLNGLLRGDIKSRFEALDIARRNGIINADEWRAMENWNPIGGEDGGAYWRPGTMYPPNAITQSQQTTDSKKGGETGQ